jgi:hypothetical protein
MKNQVIKFVHSLGGRTAYQGKTRTMFVGGPKKAHIEKQIIEKFGYGLPFRLAFNPETLKYLYP